MSDLARRLQLEDGQTIEVVGAPDEVAEVLADLATAESDDAVLAFAVTTGDVEHHADRVITAARTSAGVAWVAYPKRSSGREPDLTRDQGWDALGDAGLRPVRQIALDDTWSALRFRRAEDVKAG